MPTIDIRDSPERADTKLRVKFDDSGRHFSFDSVTRTIDYDIDGETIELINVDDDDFDDFMKALSYIYQNCEKK